MLYLCVVLIVSTMSFTRARLLFSSHKKAHSWFLITPKYINTSHRSALLCSQACSKAIASFEEIKSVKDNNILLIDVREPSELQETGVLPGSINIPLGEVESALKDMPDDEFSKRFGKNKPTVETSMIFSCKAGIRSKKAQEIAIKLGYKHTKNYSGGWIDWAERNK